MKLKCGREVKRNNKTILIVYSLRGSSSACIA
jgi:hypothetical protein